MPDPSLAPQRPEYYVQTGSMYENPFGVPHDEITKMVVELPAEVAAQVVFGKYVESSGLVFSGELIQMLLDRTGSHYDVAPAHTFASRDATWPRVTGDRWRHEPTVAELRGWARENKRVYFHTGIDFARKNDFTVIFTLDTRYRPARVVNYRRLNRVPWEGIYREVGRAVSIFGPSALCDATGMAGDVILDALDIRHYCPIHDRTVIGHGSICRDRNGAPLAGCRESDYVPLNCVDGFEFSASSKQGLIEHLRNVLSHGYLAGSEEPFGLIRCPPIVQLEEELSFYAWDDKGLDTDTVMSLALAAYQGLELTVGESHVGSPYG